MDVTLQALAELRRHQIVNAYVSNGSLIYSNAYVYAIRHSLYPIFEENQGLLSNEDKSTQFPFKDTYHVSYEHMIDIHEKLLEVHDTYGDDDSTINKKVYTFRDLDSEMKSTHIDRTILAKACRYIYLHQIFQSEEFWEAFMKDAPMESKFITSNWSIESDLGFQK